MHLLQKKIIFFAVQIYKKKTSNDLEVLFFNSNTIQQTDFRLLVQPYRKKQIEESFLMWQLPAAFADGFQAFFSRNLNQFFFA